MTDETTPTNDIIIDNLSLLRLRTLIRDNWAGEKAPIIPWVRNLQRFHEDFYDSEWTLVDEREGVDEAPPLTYVVVQGTRSRLDALVDALALPDIMKFPRGVDPMDPIYMWTHGGFLKAALRLYKNVSRQLGPREKVVFTGHSLGGALAFWLHTFRILGVGEEGEVPGKWSRCVTFAAPRVQRSWNSLPTLEETSYHFSCGWDLVPLLPPWLQPNPGSNVRFPGPLLPWKAHQLDAILGGLL